LCLENLSLLTVNMPFKNTKYQDLIPPSIFLISDKIEAEMCKELGEFEVDLDGRFPSIRSRETNLGNFVCDIMVAATNADFALLNSGTLRKADYLRVLVIF
jgi:hypothetical protein